MKKHKINKWLLIGVGTILAIVILYFIFQNYLPEINLLFHHPIHQEHKMLSQLVRSHGLGNALLLLGLIAILNAIPGFSNSVICIFAGISYGPIFGFLINWCGNILGNCVVMSLIRKVNLSSRMKKHKILHLLTEQKHPLLNMTIGFMIPVIPSVLVNYAAARLNINRRQYMTIVTIGMAPTSFLYAFGGDAIFKGNLKRIIGVLIGIAILVLLYFVVHWLSNQRKGKQETV
ncbi:VTT domain-containing protein [Lactobacillaceae bacterium 24-114]